MTRREAIAAARVALEGAGVPGAAHDAERLLLHGLGLTRAALWADPGAAVGARGAERLADLVAARAKRVPLQHLLGSVDFHRVTLAVRPGVFVPRLETETLVDEALEETAARAARSGATAGTLLDLGTGTGAVAIAQLAALPGWHGVAVDRSAAARALAAENAARCGVADRLTILDGDFLDAAFRPEGGPFDLLVSNPPYVRRGAIPGLMPEVREHDPWEALDGGPDGLDALRGIARGLPRWIGPESAVALEIGEDQADASLELFGGLLEGARVTPDLAGRPRVIRGTYRG